MSPAILFLLLAIWMEELALIGVFAAAPIGAALLAGVTYELLRYRRLSGAAVPLSATLAALSRAVGDLSSRSGKTA